MYRTDTRNTTIWPDFELVKASSDDALNLIKRQYLDLVFVDGDHNPVQVEADIRNWSKRIKNGGILVGDDYNDFTGAGIKAIVHKVVGANNINVQLDTREESGKPNWLWWTYVTHDNWTGVHSYRRQ